MWLHNPGSEFVSVILPCVKPINIFQINFRYEWNVLETWLIKPGGTFMILLANGKSLISVESQLLLNLEPKLKF